MARFDFKLHHFLVFNSVWFLIWLILTYSISVLSGHVYGFFPMLSDISAIAPERCISSQMWNLGSVFLGFIGLLRFLQIKKYMEHGYININQRWNNLSIIFGGLCCLGLSVSGNFQENETLTAHLFGALLLVWSGTSYFIVQTRLSYESVKLQKKFPKHGISERMFYFRVVIMVSIIILQWIGVGAAALAFKEFTGTSLNWWTEEHGGYKWHIVSAFSEWILFFLMLVYVGSFRGEFKLIEFEEIKIKVQDINNVKSQ